MSATHSSDEEGEGYFASASDLMVGILFVFLLMLTVFALNFRDAEDDQKVEQQLYQEAITRAEAAEKRALAAQKVAEEQQKIAEYQQKLAEEQKTAADAERLKNVQLRDLLRQAVARMEKDIKDRENARLRLLTRLDGMLKAQGVPVTIDPNSGVLRLPEQILFEKEESSLGTAAGSLTSKLSDVKLTLDKLANSMAAVLPCFTTAAPRQGCDEGDQSTLEGVLVEGHSDRQGYRENGRKLTPEESRDKNDQLSVDRALNVFKEIRQRNGLDDLKNPSGLALLAVSAYGDRRPIAFGSSEEEFQKNRRIDLRFLITSRTSSELQKMIDAIRPALEDSP